MAFREVQRMQVVEVVRRWRLGESRRSIARATGLSRNTVEKYVRAARAHGVEAANTDRVEEVGSFSPIWPDDRRQDLCWARRGSDVTRAYPDRLAQQPGSCPVGNHFLDLQGEVAPVRDDHAEVRHTSVVLVVD